MRSAAEAAPSADAGSVARVDEEQGSEAAEGSVAPAPDDASPRPTTVRKVRRPGIARAAMVGMARALSQIYEPAPQDPDEVVWVVDADEPIPDGPVTVELDRDDPRASVATVRPHLFPDRDPSDH